MNMRIVLKCVLTFSSYLIVGGHGPHHPRGSAIKYANKLTQEESLLHDREHIKEDLKDALPKDATLTMTPQELEFYYFTLHDTDNNTKLDGLEMLQAIHHVGHKEDNAIDDDKFTDQLAVYIDLIDKVLEDDDVDGDGYLSYAEYIKGRNREDVRH